MSRFIIFGCLTLSLMFSSGCVRGPRYAPTTIYEYAGTCDQWADQTCNKKIDPLLPFRKIDEACWQREFTRCNYTTKELDTKE